MSKKLFQNQIEVFKLSELEQAKAETIFDRLALAHTIISSVVGKDASIKTDGLLMAVFNALDNTKS